MILAASVGVDNETRRGLTQGQGLFQGQQHEFGGYVRGGVGLIKYSVKSNGVWMFSCFFGLC